MSWAVLALVLASGFVHAVWNMWAKGSRRPLVFLWSFQWVAVALYAPFAWHSLANHALPPRGMLLLLATIALHGAYVLLLARSYKLADFSQLYPIMRGTSPLLVPLLATAVIGERLPAMGWLGAGLVVLGVIIVAGGLPSRKALTGGAYVGVLVGLAITGYTLVDKLTLAYVPAVALNVLSNAGNLAVLTIPALGTREAWRECRERPLAIFAAGVLSPLSYLLFLWALRQGPVAALGPMREIGIVFGALLGVFWLREANAMRRILGSLLITAGVIALATQP